MEVKPGSGLGGTRACLGIGDERSNAGLYTAAPDKPYLLRAQMQSFKTKLTQASLTTLFAPALPASSLILLLHPEPSCS